MSAYREDRRVPRAPRVDRVTKEDATEKEKLARDARIRQAGNPAPQPGRRGFGELLEDKKRSK